MDKKNGIYHGLTLLSHCGGGAYGDVYYCQDISGRRLAVKIVSKNKLGEHWERELRGVTNYRKITENSPELLQIFHVEEDEETFFYTMEPADSASPESYLPDTLALRLKEAPLPQTNVFRVLSGIFGGLKTIHDAGFAHRDIKPDNILFVKGDPKLGDIGLMSSLTNSLTQIAGTLDFLPPEIRTSDGLDSSARESCQRNDLYAFGKVIYCVVTGQDPHAWPTVPPSLPLTLPLKFFLRLSFQLCNKDPSRRLDSMEKLESEFTEIERKLLYGETLGDKCRYLLKTFLCDIRGGWIHGFRWGKKHWLLLATILLCIGGASWYLWPEPPFDITKQKTKTYTNPKLGLSMTIPFHWESISVATFFKILKEAQKDNVLKMNQKMVDYLEPMAPNLDDIIFCDRQKDLLNNITAIALPIQAKLLLDMPEDELRLYVRHSNLSVLGLDLKIYEVKHKNIAGYPCLFTDFSYDSTFTRTNSYFFVLKKKCLSITFTAEASSFSKSREQFDAVLETIKFSDDTPFECKNPFPDDSK